jgi:hypothetical protein
MSGVCEVALCWGGLERLVSVGSGMKRVTIVDMLCKRLRLAPLWGRRFGRWCPSMFECVKGTWCRQAGLKRTGWMVKLLQSVFVTLGLTKEKSNTRWYVEKMYCEWKNGLNVLTRRRKRWKRENVRKMCGRGLSGIEIEKLILKWKRRVMSGGENNNWVTCMKWWVRQCRKRGCWDVGLRVHVSSAVAGVCEGDEAMREVECARDEGESVDSGGGLVVCSMNVGGFTNMEPMLATMPGDVKVVAMQETKVPLRVARVRAPSGWIVHNQRRKGIMGGGVGFAVDRGVSASVLRDISHCGDGKGGVEWLWLRVDIVAVRGENDDGRTPKHVYICNVYASPNHSYGMLKRVFETATRLQRGVGCVGVCIMGDTNCPLLSDAKLLGAGCSIKGTCVRQRRAFWWRNMRKHTEWELLNERDPVPTHAQKTSQGKTVYTVIDNAVWCGAKDGVAAFQVLNDGGADHRILRVVFRRAARAVSFTSVVRWGKLRRGATEARLQSAERFCQETDCLAKCYEVDGKEQSIQQWTDMVIAAGGEALGMTRPPKVAKSYLSQPWWSFELTRLSQQYKRARRNVWRLRGRSKRRCVDAETVASAVFEMQMRRLGWRRALRRTKDVYWRAKRGLMNRKGPDAVREMFSVFRLVTGRRGANSGVVHSQPVMEAAWKPILGTAPPASSRNDAYARLVMEWRDNHEDVRLNADEKITFRELNNVICTLPNYKAAGVDTVTNEALKALSDNVVAMLARAFNHMLDAPRSRLPASWLRSLVTLIPKVDEPSPTDYRPITLLSCVAKCLETVMWRRLVASGAHRQLEFDQGGFQTGRGCMEQVWRVVVLGQILRTRRRQGLVLFFDIKKAYDSVPHEVLMYRLIEEQPDLPPYFVRFVDVWLRGHRRELLAGAADGERLGLDVARGVPQGSVLACFLFNVFFNSLLRRLHDNVRGITLSMRWRGGGSEDESGVGSVMVRGRRLRRTAARRRGGAAGAYGGRGVSTFEWRMVSPAFADDLAVTVESEADAQRACQVVEEWQTESGTWFAAKKSAVLRIGHCPKKQAERMRAVVWLNGEELPVVKSFRYLGVTIQGADVSHRYRRRLNNSNVVDSIGKWSSRDKFMLESRNGCTVDVAATLAMMTFRPKMLYGTEVFPLQVGSIGGTCKTRKAMAKIAKIVLNTYDSASTTAAFEFLGWEAPRSSAYRRVLGFALKMASSPFPELRKIMLSVMELAGVSTRGDDNPGGYDVNRDSDVEVIEWWKYVQEAVLFGVNAGWFSSEREFYVALNTAEGSREMAVVVGAAGKVSPHPVVQSSSGHAYYTFPFRTGLLNPRRSIVGARPDCHVCGAVEADTVEHLVRECVDERIEQIIRECVSELGLQRAEVMDVLTCTVTPDVLGARQWGAVAKAHRRLWKLRIKMRKRNVEVALD